MKLKYKIKSDFITICSTKPRRRNGNKLKKIVFLTAHDTGNKNSTAQQNVTYYKNSYNKDFASAHLFVDDKGIIMCIPAFNNPEQANHVLYDATVDNKMFGIDANDGSIGIELCFFDDKKRSQLAYEKYVWLLAYLCYFHKLNPTKDITSHEILDPKNKRDPSNGLKYSNHTFKDLIKDVEKEYKNMITPEKKTSIVSKVVNAVKNKTQKQYKTVSSDVLSFHSEPSVQTGKSIGQLKKGDTVEFLGETGAWSKILFNNKTGYVVSKHLK